MKRDSYKTFTYPSDYDEKKCEEFINHFINLAMFISVDILKRSNRYFGLDLARTAAYEGCFKAFILSSKIENIEYKHQKGYVRMCTKRAFWSFATIFGYIPSSGQIHFPIEWIDYDSYFSEKKTESNFYNDIDVNIINNIVKNFPEKESEIHQLYISGYDFAEIGRKLRYKNKSSPLKMHQRTIERVKKIISKN